MCKHGDHVNPCVHLVELKDRTSRVKVCLGKRCLDHFIENTEEHAKADTDDKAKTKENAFGMFVAHLVIMLSNSAKFDSLKGILRTQFSLGNNQCSAATHGATDASSKHCRDNHKECNQRNKSKINEWDNDNDSQEGKAHESGFA